MGSKTLLFFCIFLAIFLMITSQVAARELAETSPSVDNSKTVGTNGVEDWYGGGGFGGGYGGYGGYPGGGYGGGYGGGGYCRFGCCERNYYGGCCRCCSYPSQAVDAEPQN